MHPPERTVCCLLIRFSWHGASCPCEILRFSTVSLPEVQKKRAADFDFQTGWAHVSNQAHQVSPRGVSDWWRESVRKSVSVHQDKIRGSAIPAEPSCPRWCETGQRRQLFAGGCSHHSSCNWSDQDHPQNNGHSLAFRTGCAQSVVMHTYTQVKRLALRLKGGSLHSCPQSKPNNEGLTKRVSIIAATCLYSLIGPQTTVLSM